MRHALFLVVTLLAAPQALAAKVTVPPELRMDAAGPMWPELCISTVPSAGKLPKGDREPLQSALDKLVLGKAGEASSVLAGASKHDGVRSVAAMADLMTGNAQVGLATLDELAAAHPTDDCLLRGSALARQMLGAPGARELAEQALAAKPTEPDNAMLAAILSFIDGDVPAAQSALDVGLAASPGQPKLLKTRGIILLESGDQAGALAALNAASDAGEDVGELLVDAAWGAADLPAYLRGLARSGAPLPDAAAIAADADPVAHWRDFMGFGSGDPVVWIDTSQGRLRCQLWPEHAPLTVSVFVGFGTGRLAWTDPQSGALREDPLYLNTGFHRVIPGFMIQGGDPLGTGTGGPGFRFRDEVRDTDAFDRPGLLAMANAGPGTNGSQFFVTDAATPWLDGRHTMFGACDEESVAVARAIAALPRDDNDRPVEPVRILGFELLSSERVEAMQGEVVGPAEAPPVPVPVPSAADTGVAPVATPQ